MRIRAALLLGLLAVLGGCSALPGTGVDVGDVDPPPLVVVGGLAFRRR